MASRRSARGLFVPAALAILVIVLAILQYSWLGQVSAADRQDIRASLDRRARAFADDVDREIGELYAAFADLGGATGQPSASDIAQHLAAWKATAGFPDLIRTISIVDATGPRDTLAMYEPAQQAFRTVPWPDDLGPVRSRLGVQGTVRWQHGQFLARIVGAGGEPIVDAVPALLIALPAVAARLSQTPAGLMSSVMDRIGRRRVLIVQLDRAYLLKTMLPAILDRHFESARPLRPAGAAPHRDVLPPTLHSLGPPPRVQIVDAAGTVLLTRGPDTGAVLSGDRADVTVPFFAVRFDSKNGLMTTLQALASSIDGNSWRPPSAAPFADAGRGPWRLLVQDGAGSLDRAVALARRRNLYVGFGILSLLVASMGLVLVNARRSERLAAQQMEFVATVSHELRTPLAVIRSAAENLSAGVVHEGARTREYGELIEAEGRRLSDMVEQVLEHAGVSGHREPPRRAEVDVGDLVRGVVAACGPMAARAGLVVDVAIAPDLPHLTADEDALRRALQNLVANAVKHAAAGAWIGVTARRTAGDRRIVRRDRQRLSAGIVRPLEIVELAVGDRGPGIDAGDRARLFEPFYRGRAAIDGQVPGSGLGLSLVARIVADHGGRVTVGVTPGGGTTFTIELPVVPAIGTAGPGAA
jgi:signal transduction histidine kinase